MYKNDKNKKKTMKKKTMKKKTMKKKTMKKKTMKKKTMKNKPSKCYSFCKNDYVKNVNHEFKEYNNKQKKLMFNECKNIYCSDDCLKQHIKNLGLDENNKDHKFLIENYKNRLDNNFLTDIDKRYKNPNKYKQELIKKGVLSSCFSLNKDYYNPFHK
jgi:hypothetical protein